MVVWYKIEKMLAAHECKDDILQFTFIFDRVYRHYIF